MTLHNRDFLTLKDFSQKEITYLLNLAAKLKKDKKAGITHGTLKGKNVALIFEKPSTRTRCAFTVACADEGGYSEYLGKNEIQLGHKESVEDTARVLSRMFDGIEFRGFSHEKVETLAKYSDVPVWNGLTDDYHPTQILADFLTIQEKLGKLAGVKMVFAGDGRNNMANSLMIGCAKMGLHFVIAAPKALQPEESLRLECQALASANGRSGMRLSGRGCFVYRCVVLHGRGGQNGGAGSTAGALPDQRRHHGESKGYGDLSALPAGCKRE